MSRVLRFDGTRLVAASDPLAGSGADASPQLADSFMSRRATVRNFSAHRTRFEQGVSEVAPELLTQLDSFYGAVAAELEEETEAFPRTDVVEGQLWLRVRPLPALTETVLARSERLDVSQDDIKGPNIARYTERNRTNDCETIRVDEYGQVLEGATSALMWWDDETAAPVLHTVRSANRVWSTTEAFIAEHARALGYAVKPATIGISELTQHEVWAVNGLQGIRVVTAIDEHPTRQSNDLRRDTFRSAFDASWQSIVPELP